MFGIYDDLTSDHVPGLQKYDMCMTEQVPGPQGVKIVGRHMPSAPNESVISKLSIFSSGWNWDDLISPARARCGPEQRPSANIIVSVRRNEVFTSQFIILLEGDTMKR